MPNEQEDRPIKWIYRPIIGKYSPLDFARTGIAIGFIMACMSLLTLYIHYEIDTTSELKSTFDVEFVNMTREDVYDKDNNLVLKAPDLIIDRILEFPLSYDKLDMQGYILLDSVTGIRYMYIRNTSGIAITKYWTWEESQYLAVRVHEYKDMYEDRPLREDLP
jgi:hypothetical protein